MDKQQGSIFIYLLLGIVTLSTSVLVLKVRQIGNYPQQKTQTTLPQPTEGARTINQKSNSPSLTDQGIIRNKQLDFSKILNEEYLNLKEEKYGFSLSYPPESELFYYTDEQSKMKGFTKKFNGATFEKTINISLTPIITDVATEFYEGLSIDIFFLKKTASITLDQFVKSNTGQYEKTQSDKNSPYYSQFTKEEVIISNHKVIKTIYEDHRDKIYRYFLLNKSQIYFIVLEIYPVGNDIKQYEKVANRIIGSIILL